MLKTGKDAAHSHAFNRQLLSEYNTDITLDNYVSYFELKPIAKDIEKIRKKLEEMYRGRYIAAGGTNLSRSSSLPLTPAGLSSDIAVTHCGSSAYIFSDPLSPLLLRSDGFQELRKTDAVLADLLDQRIQLQELFFDKLYESYVRVKKYLSSLEHSFVISMEELHQYSETYLREQMPPSYIPSLYIKLEVILQYRTLNLLAFRKILKKFLERCACDNLELQRRVCDIDDLIHKSNISEPSIDLRSAVVELIAIYGTVYRLSYEEAITRMKQFECRSGATEQRILPNSESFFFTNSFPYHERPGNFAVRVLAGTCSLFSEKMITQVLQCPRYPGESCGQFANGEISVNLKAPVRGDDVFIIQSMVGIESANLSNAGSVMELALMIQSVQLAAAARITAVIPYLAYTRNVASISALAEIVESMGCHHVVTVDTHSDQVEGMFSIPMESISAMYEFVRYLGRLLQAEGHGFQNISIVSPTGDFVGRAKEFADALMRFHHLDAAEQFVSVCTAVKRVQTKAAIQGPSKSEIPPSVAFEKARVAAAAAAAAATALRERQVIPQVPLLSSPQSATTPTAKAAAAGLLSEQSPLHHDFQSTSTPVTAKEFFISSPAVRNPAECMRFGPDAPTVIDSYTNELVSVAAAAQQQQQNAGVSGGDYYHSDEDTQRSSSTIGMEKALRMQEGGRRAVLAHKIEEAREEYKKIALVGDVKNRLCIMYDTVIDEAVHLCQIANSLRDHGAERIILVATHAVMSGDAVQRLLDSPIELIIVTDSVNQYEAMKNPQLARRMRVLPIAPLLARAIEKIHTESTLTTLFEKA